MATILTVDDESGIRDFLADTLVDEGHEVFQAGDGFAALEQLADRPIDLAIVDFRMPGRIDGMELVRRIRAERPETQVILLTAHGSIGMAVEAMRLGAFDFLEKPLAGPDELRRLVRRALNWRAAPRAALAAAPVAPSRDDEPPAPPAPRDITPLGLLVRLSREMKRRHVYNVAATYAAVAFIALQAAELVLPALPVIPSWSYSALVALAAAGFPAALALGWIFDVKVSRTGRARMLNA